MMPACPSCGDLSAPGSEWCETCGAALTEEVAYLGRMDGLLRDEDGHWHPLNAEVVA